MPITVTDEQADPLTHSDGPSAPTNESARLAGLRPSEHFTIPDHSASIVVPAKTLEDFATLVGLVVRTAGAPTLPTDESRKSAGAPRIRVFQAHRRREEIVFAGEPTTSEDEAPLSNEPRRGAYVVLPVADSSRDDATARADEEAGGLVLAVELDGVHEWSHEELAGLRTVAGVLARELQVRGELAAVCRDMGQWQARRLYDAVTGLPHRELFVERLEQAVRRASRHTDFHFAVLFLDIDQLEAIYHGLGRDVGDELVRAIAERLKPLVRAEDLLARSTSEGFLILLEHVDDDTAAGRVALRVQDALSTPLIAGDTEVSVSASIGVMLSSGGLDSPDRLIALAGVARARAQEIGMGEFQIFQPAMQERVRRRLDRETELRRAVERQEFEVFYQPLICLKTGRITEIEALVRWNHPQRGRLSGAEFIPLAEETEVILPLGWWVIANACPQMREWQQRFPREVPLALTVNVSARHLGLADFVARIGGIVAAAGLDPRSLRLEITESVLIGDPEAARAKLSELRRSGFSVYLDDFGSGYSSLRYLSGLPLDGVKLDRDFIEGISSRQLEAPIVRTVRELARDIGVRAIAEGIESDAQLTVLRALGYDLGQGYFIGRPMPAADMAAVLERDPRWAQ
ncbi:MAG: sensor-containing diguanylate cyclase/phosphodiesterase [Gemmatimonadetes bacterium]|nr:sensor-containing diguanylate cyclase/phosphodiesterase [Gemmatimonadota bacterium]